MGFVKVANETMCRPIRALTQANLVTTHLGMFRGGAGGQYACASSLTEYGYCFCTQVM